MLLVLIGGTVMLGWAMQLSLLVRVLPGFTPMVFNTALCFVLAAVVPERKKRAVGHHLITQFHPAIALAGGAYDKL